MKDQKSLLTLTIDTKEPIELAAFVGAFTSISGEFDRLVQQKFPESKTEVTMLVKDVRHGSFVADIVTGIASTLPGVISSMDQILIFEDFVRRWGKRFNSIVHGDFSNGGISTPSELKDWANTVRAIACDPAATHQIEAATFEDGERKVRASFKFATPEARTALEKIEDRKRELSEPEAKLYIRALMVFTRSDINNAAIGKSSGERVKIEEIHEKSLALMYGSEVAEDKIKREIREADENVYKKGFVVDVYLKVISGKPVAYSIVNVHEIIDLPD